MVKKKEKVTSPGPGKIRKMSHKKMERESISDPKNIDRHSVRFSCSSKEQPGIRFKLKSYTYKKGKIMYSL